VASKLSLCDTKNSTVVDKIRNRNLIDWRNWNKSLYGENLLNLFLLIALLAVDVAALRPQYANVIVSGGVVFAACVKAGGAHFG